MNDLDLLRVHRPETPAPDEDARRRARAVLADAMRAEATQAQRAPRRPARRRLVPAAGLVTALAALLVLGLGTLPGSSPSPDGAGPSLFRPAPAGALTEVVPTDDGMVEIRFLHPDADPERIAAELADHGLAVDVTFVPSDPFTVGTMVMSSAPEGASPIETIREGSDITGGGTGHLVGIRVPQGWTGEGHEIAIGREPLPGEGFDSAVALNAERPGGPLHCTPVRGLRAAAAADVVAERGMTVSWRTHERRVTGMRTTMEEPPADYWIHDAIWSAPKEIILFAEDRAPEPSSARVAELLARGCGEVG